MSRNILFCNNNLFCVRKCFDPIAEGMPFGKFVRASCKVDVDQCLIVHCYSAHLVIAGWKKLDHIIPIFFVLAFFHIFLSDFFEFVYNCLHKCQCVRCHVIVTKIINVERFCMDFMHCACGVCNSCNFVSVKFFPIRGLSFTIA